MRGLGGGGSAVGGFTENPRRGLCKGVYGKFGGGGGRGPFYGEKEAPFRRKRLESKNCAKNLGSVDVRIFFFFCSGEGKGQSEAPRGVRWEATFY